MKFKPLFLFFALLGASLGLQACSTNPATGKQQFTALMSPQQENKVGASEHENIVAQYGLYDNAAISRYVSRVGARVTAKTERPDVKYQFFVLDSPIVNAFALPGGYIYISRGLLALANSEAQMAAVLSHEAGHVTGRHTAERYSRSVVTSLGTGILGAVIGSAGASQALGLGANLYLSSYSRGQESEADSLGLRYMTQGGYDPDEMTAFLSSMSANSNLESRLQGKSGAGGGNYFSTHPATADRVAASNAQAKNYPQNGTVNRDGYLQAINGMTYGDSEKQGFVRDQSFYHPGLGFTFTVPKGFNISNQPNQVAAIDNASGSVIVYDMDARQNGMSAQNYLTQIWMKDKPVQAERITINGMNAATAGFSGSVNNKPMTIRVIAIEFKPNTFARFMVGVPNGASQSLVDALKTATYSFRPMSAAEKQNLKPYRLRLVTAQSGDTIASLARRMPFTTLQEDRFRVLNGLLPNEALVTGRQYKTVGY
ncbi:MAG: M48 family metalloprotease [Bdellovibrionales bacterium]